jgi:hypothetical protein
VEDYVIVEPRTHFQAAYTAMPGRQTQHLTSAKRCVVSGTIGQVRSRERCLPRGPPLFSPLQDLGLEAQRKFRPDALVRVQARPEACLGRLAAKRCQDMPYSTILVSRPVRIGKRRHGALGHLGLAW